MSERGFLAWIDLEFSIALKRKFKFPWSRRDQGESMKLLDGVSGELDRGEMVAILGASGKQEFDGLDHLRFWKNYFA